MNNFLNKTNNFLSEKPKIDFSAAEKVKDKYKIDMSKFPPIKSVEEFQSSGLPKSIPGF